MKKSLPLKYPTITTYTQHAHLLAVLENDPKTLSWILSNYIELYIDKDLRKYRWMDFYFPMPFETRPMEICKWVVVQKNSLDFLKNSYKDIDIIDIILMFLKDGYYVNIMVNYKYILKSNFGGLNVDKYHDILIYGYDDDIKVFNCADFLFSSSGHYSFGICSFDEMKNAVNDELSNNEDSYLNHMIYSYKLRDKSNYNYNPKNIINGLKQYYSGAIPEYWKQYENTTCNNYAWGIDCYDIIAKDIMENKNHVANDIALLYLLMDHKKMMKKRLIFMEKHCDCPNILSYLKDYDIIFEKCRLMVNMAIKGGLFNDYRIVERLIEKIKETKSKEQFVLNNLIAELEVII